jgi:hypothetical protein
MNPRPDRKQPQAKISKHSASAQYFLLNTPKEVFAGIRMGPHRPARIPWFVQLGRGFLSCAKFPQ